MAVRIVLPEPELGEAVLRHDPEFVALDAGLSSIRDTVNLGIDVLNHAGAGLRRLPDGSLEELLVRPLTGDYTRIRQNAEATHQVEEALRCYAGNVEWLAVSVGPRWGGAAASSYLLRLQAHAVAALGLAEVVGRSAVVYDEVAEHSERLAVEVEDLVMELVERGQRVVRKLLARIAGPLGWGAFALELATDGLDAVTDIVEDVRRILEVVDRLLDLQQEVSDWVEQQRQRLELLRELPGAFDAGGGGASW